MRNIQQHVEACYLKGSSKRCEGRREEAGERKVKQKLSIEKCRGAVETPKNFNSEKAAVNRGNYSE